MRYFFLLLITVSSYATAQDFSLFQKKEFAYESNVLPYRILFPEGYDNTKKYPLILLLHGAGERGKDNEKQLVHGAKLFLTDANRKDFSAIVIVPQCPVESAWINLKFDTTKRPYDFWYDYSANPNWPLIAANELVKKIAAEEGVDKKRIYITGLSMGGMGTFESVFRYPDMYAAAMPICGGGDSVLYDSRIKPIKFWVFHGDADPVVNVKYSRKMVNKLQLINASVKYTEYPGVYHNSWDNAFAELDFLKWMFGQKRKSVK
jgi:predicted peptidase